MNKIDRRDLPHFHIRFHIIHRQMFRDDWEEDEAPSRHPSNPHDQERPNEFHFEVFTNPLEMHRFFDQQMEQILKSFGLGQGFGGFGQGPPAVPFERHPGGMLN